MTKKEIIYRKYGGKCAYSGSPLEPDWQMDHLFPKRYSHYLDHPRMIDLFNIKLSNINDITNLMPCQKLINNYKRDLLIDDPWQPKWNFRHRISNLHRRLAQLPKNPRTEKSVKLKAYLLQIAEYFNISPDKPFDGIFYYEKLAEDNKSK